MKEVLISIQPKWCELIASGKKTIEVRKTAPKLETPFKCYIYCTNEKHKGEVLLIDNRGKRVALGDYRNAFHWKNIGNGKVIGEFVCDRITKHESEFWDDETYERVQELVEPQDFNVYGEYDYYTVAESGDEDYQDKPLFKQSCLNWNELRNYIGRGIHEFYGWHISDLKIYDKPKEMGEFRTPCPKPNSIYVDDCMSCKHFYIKENSGRHCCDGWIKRPPQSWCYVEEL